MASRDLRLALREAAVQHLRANVPLTQLVSPSQIHGERVPAGRVKPYIAFSRMDLIGFDAQDIRGGRIPLRLNVFVDAEDSGLVIKISAAVVEALDDAQLELDGGWCLDISYVRTNSITSGTETTSWHDVIDFSALTGVGD